MNSFKRKISGGLIALLAISSQMSRADIVEFIDNGTFNDLEASAAIAANQTYLSLFLVGCTDDQTVGRDGCDGQTFQLWSNVREIAHTANELLNDGPTQFSLGLDEAGLGFALRWTAAEEYAAQGNLSSEFIGGQASSLASRLTALRAGASGFNVIGIANAQNSDEIAYIGPLGGASGDASYGRWGGFLNVDLSSGDRAPTAREDAFDFAGSQVSFGGDYRFDSNWVGGVVMGISQQNIDFDGSQSIVEGSIEADGYSLMPFAMYQLDNWFYSAALGYQTMRFDTVREIRYPSLNLDIDSANTTTVSDTKATSVSLFFEAGYTWQVNKFSIEPFLNFKHSDTTVDEFVEEDLNDSAFDLVVEEQNINSQEFTFGTKLQYTYTPSFGVWIPFFTFEAIKQNENASRDIKAYYAQNSVSDGSVFSLPTEEQDSSYFAYTFGVSAVIRGGRQTKAGGSIGGDIQGFLNYKTIQALEGFNVDLYSFGVRYTF
ncbi:MAG: autotransporter outer membrane beta-barrel domain-containing protein [Agarilytica sp.]